VGNNINAISSFAFQDFGPAVLNIRSQTHSEQIWLRETYCRTSEMLLEELVL